MMKSSAGERPVYGVIASVIAMYWVISITMVFMNKHILSGAFGDEDVTVFSAWFQSAAAVGTIFGLAFTSNKCGISLRIPAIDFNQLFSKNMLFLSMSSVSALTFNNLMLKHIGVAFYQVARSFTIIFTIFLSSIMLKKGLSWKAFLACLLVIFGFIIGIDQEDASGDLSVFGIIYGILASFSAAVCGIFYKRAEKTLEGDSLKQAYYNNLNSTLIFLPLVISTGQLSAVLSSDLTVSPKFWIMLTVGGSLSLAIGWVSSLQIKYTSPITHHLSINSKSVCQTVLAVLYFQESKTFMWWVGNCLVVVGVLLYAFTKIQEDRVSLDSVQSTKSTINTKP